MHTAEPMDQEDSPQGLLRGTEEYPLPGTERVLLYTGGSADRRRCFLFNIAVLTPVLMGVLFALYCMLRYALLYPQWLCALGVGYASVVLGVAFLVGDGHTVTLVLLAGWAVLYHGASQGWYDSCFSHSANSRFDCAMVTVLFLGWATAGVVLMVCIEVILYDMCGCPLDASLRTLRSLYGMLVSHVFQLRCLFGHLFALVDVIPQDRSGDARSTNRILQGCGAALWYPKAAVGFVLELSTLVPVAIPLLVEPALRRYLQLRGEVHVLVLTHGMGVNSANFVFGRYVAALHGYKTNVFYPCWLAGWNRCNYNGNVAQVQRVYNNQMRQLESQWLIQNPEPTGALQYTLAGHSTGGLLSAQFGAEHPAQVRAVVFLSTPFKGSRLLGWFRRQCCQCYRLCAELDSPINVDFTPGSDCCCTLLQTLRRLAKAVGPNRLIFFTGSIDFMVGSDSGLCFDYSFVSNTGAQSNGCNDDREVPQFDSLLDNSERYLVSNVGHFSIAAVSSLWDSFLQVIEDGHAFLQIENDANKDI